MKIDTYKNLIKTVIVVLYDSIPPILLGILIARHIIDKNYPYLMLTVAATLGMITRSLVARLVLGNREDRQP